MKRIYLVRHGQTEWNAAGRWQGMLDVPLSDVGHEQAHLLADYLRDRPIGAVYSSDLTRAWKTAEPLAQLKGLDVHKDERLREVNYGVFQGMTHEEIRTRFPTEERSLMSDYMDFVAPEGESRRQVQARAYAAWQEIVGNGTGPEILIVTHGGPVRVLLMKLFPDQLDRMMKVPVPNTSVTTLVQDEHGVRLESLSSIRHLEKVTRSDSP